MSEKYLILCNRHESIYGHEYALWWGYREQSGGYSSDFRNAHLYEYDEIKKHHLNDSSDPAIKLSDLGYTEDQFRNLPQDENLRVLIEKGTLNELSKMNLKDRRAEYGRIENGELGQRMQWVSVAESLPPLEKDIDIYTIDKNRLINAWHIGNGRFLHGDTVFEREEVTHYMITPPDPKGAE